MQRNENAFGFNRAVCSVCGSCTALQQSVDNSSGKLYCCDCIRAVQRYCIARNYITEAFAIHGWYLSSAVGPENYLEVELDQPIETLLRKVGYEDA